jgi:hypothetical protein
MLATFRAVGAEPARVIVVMGGGDTARLEKVVNERLRNAGAHAEIRTSPSVDPRALRMVPTPEPGVLAHVWIDFSQRDEAFVLILDAKVERGLGRSISRASGDEVAREEVGHVVQTAVEELMAGEPIGRPREELGLEGRPTDPRPKPTPRPIPRDAPSSPTPPSGAHWRVRSTVGYEISAFTSAAPVIQGPRGSFEIVGHSASSPLIWGLRASAQWRFPVEAHVSPFVVRLAGGALRAEGLVEYALGGAWSFGAALGGGVDVIRVLPHSAIESEAMIAPPTTVVAPMGRASIGLTKSGRFRWALWFVCDFDVSAVHYDYFTVSGARGGCPISC